MVSQLADLQAQLCHNGPLVEVLTHGGRVLQAEDHAQLAGLLGGFDVLYGLDLHDLVGIVLEQVVVTIHIFENALEAGLGRGEGNALNICARLEDALQVGNALPLRGLGVNEVAAQAVNKQVFIVELSGSLFLGVGQCDRFHV